MKEEKPIGFFTALYRFEYGLGLHTVRLFGRIGRWFGRVTAAPRRTLRYLWLRRVYRPVRRFLYGVAWLFPHNRPAGVTYFESTREQWKMLGRFLGPIVGCAALAISLGAWSGADYYLSVNYRGVDLGVVESAEVYAQGAAMALDRVNNVDESFSVDAVPVFTMTMQNHYAPLTPEEVCDAILSTSEDIVSATGLYVNNKFVAAMESRAELNALLSMIQHADEHYDPKNESMKVGFVQKTKVTDGLYPISTLLTSKEMEDQLTKETVAQLTHTVEAGEVLGTIAEKYSMTLQQLRELNEKIKDTDSIKPGDTLVVQKDQHFLQVKVVVTHEPEEETIDYKTNTVYRDDMYTDERPKVVTKGREGKQTVVRETVYVDGVKQSTKVVKRTVTEKAINEVVELGTKKRPGSQIEQGDGITHGSMLWPVPICHSMSRGFGGGHYGLDICNGPVKVLGHPAVAADGGTVIQASTGWNGGYGNVVKIRHSNGLVTVYAHLQSVKVTNGQWVSRGQTIGLVGNSGRSSGPHLHFEVIKNGVKVNPRNYVDP